MKSSTSQRQFSFCREGTWHLAVVTKRTYDVSPDGTCHASEEASPIVDGEPRTSDLDSNLVEADLDVLPPKERTDVIVQGHIHASGSAALQPASLAVARHRKEILAVGDRRCALSATGRLLFSAPEPFDRMPVSFARAYGGRDRVAETVHGNPFAALAPFLRGTQIDPHNMSNFLYPKNPCGRGYLIEATPAAVEECALPNLEDPRDRLSPDRLVVGRHDRWIYMPIPQAFGWVGWGWFPRVTFAGLRQGYQKEPTIVPEVARGLIPQDLLDEAGRPSGTRSARIFNGAPLDQQLASLRGDEDVELTHLHPTRSVWRFRLPGPPRRICTDGREGRLNETKPFLQTVVIEPDESRVSLTWCGAAPARRRYLPAELEAMPLVVEW